MSKDGRAWTSNNHVGGPCEKMLLIAIEEATVTVAGRGKMIDMDRIPTTLEAGRAMEESTELLRTATDELRTARREMRNMTSEIREMCTQANNDLTSKIAEFRSTRMSLVNECRDSLGVLRDVRKFFLESDYETEMNRLDRLVRVCREIKELKELGVFDAIVDSAIKMGIR